MANYLKINKNNDIFRSHLWENYEPEEFSDWYDVPFTVVRNSSYFNRFDVEYDNYNDTVSESYLKQISDDDFEKYESIIDTLTDETVYNIVAQNYENDGRQDELSTDDLLNKAYILCTDNGMSSEQMESLSETTEWYNIESWYTGKDIYVSYTDDEISLDMLDTGSEPPKNSVKVVDNGTMLDKRTITLYDTPNDLVDLSRTSVRSTTALSYANDILTKNNIKDSPSFANKDVYAVQYGRNNDKVMVYNMNHKVTNRQHVRIITQTWQNATVIPLVENGVVTSSDALTIVDSLDNSKTQQKVDLSDEQLKSLSNTIHKYKSKLTYEVTLEPNDTINYLRADRLKELFPRTETTISSKLLDDYDVRTFITMSHDNYQIKMTSGEFNRFNELTAVLGKDKIGQIMVDVQNHSSFPHTENLMSELEFAAENQHLLTTDDFKGLSSDLEL